MKSPFGWSLLLFALLAVSGGLSAKTTVSKQIAPGVEVVQTILDAADPGGPLMIHAVVVDPNRPGVRVEAWLGGDTVEEPNASREPLPLTAARAGAVAAVNGDFFSFTNGDPIGLHIHRGEIVSEPGIRSGAGFTADGRAVFGAAKLSATVKAPNGDSLAIGGLNRQGSGELILYAPIYGLKTPKAAATIVTLESGGKSIRSGVTLSAEVVSVSQEQDAVAIPPTGLVLSASGTSGEWLKSHLKPGDTIALTAKLTGGDKDWDAVTEFVSGGPSLMRNGSIFINTAAEQTGESFSTLRHPRTAVGARKDGRVVLAVLDGRQALSRGASLTETAQAMKDLGCVEAVNMDGGGSSTLWARGLIINSPSDGAARSITNSLLVFAEASLPASAATVVVPEPISVSSSVKPGRALGGGTDHVYGTQNGKVFVDQNGRLFGYKTGTARVGALNIKTGDRREWTVNAVPGEFSRLLTTWADGTLRVTSVDVNANIVPGKNVSFVKDDGSMMMLTTGDDGRALLPVGWLTGESEPVTIRSDKVSRRWPDNAPPAPESKPPAAAGVKQVVP